MYEDEGLINVVELGGDSCLPKIGEVLRSPLPKASGNHNQIAITVKNGEVSAFYNVGNAWHSVDVQIVDYAERFKRTPFDECLLGRLWKSRVLIFGLGSGGCTITLGLVRAGVGHLRLADPGHFHIENVSRHECDLLDLERYKVHCGRERIARINPDVEAEVFPFDVFAEDCPASLDSLFDEVDLIVAATDRTSVQLAINAEAWGRGIPGLYGGCYEEARGGEILFTLPGEGTPCLECLRGGLAQPEIKGSIDYSRAQSPEDYEGEPGLHAAVSLINSVETMYALAMLLRNEDCELAKLIDPSRNFLLIGGALGAGFYLFKQPFHIFSPRLLGPRKNCSVCQRKELTPREKQAAEDAMRECSAVPDDLREFF